MGESPSSTMSSSPSKWLRRRRRRKGWILLAEEADALSQEGLGLFQEEERRGEDGGEKNLMGNADVSSTLVRPKSTDFVIVSVDISQAAQFDEETVPLVEISSSSVGIETELNEENYKTIQCSRIVSSSASHDELNEDLYDLDESSECTNQDLLQVTTLSSSYIFDDDEEEEISGPRPINWDESPSLEGSINETSSSGCDTDSNGQVTPEAKALVAETPPEASKKTKKSRRECVEKQASLYTRMLWEASKDAVDVSPSSSLSPPGSPDRGRSCDDSWRLSSNVDLLCILHKNSASFPNDIADEYFDPAESAEDKTARRLYIENDLGLLVGHKLFRRCIPAVALLSVAVLALAVGMGVKSFFFV